MAVADGGKKYRAIGHRFAALLAERRGDWLAASGELELALREFEASPAPLVTWRLWAQLGRVREMQNAGVKVEQALRCAARDIEWIGSQCDDVWREPFLSSREVSEVIHRAR